MHSLEELSHQIAGARGRAQRLSQRAAKEPVWTHEIEPEALQELQVTLEELQVAEEELRQQNEQLAGAREEVETERQRYQELFEFAPDGYLVTSPEGIIREA